MASRASCLVSRLCWVACAAWNLASAGEPEDLSRPFGVTVGMTFAEADAVLTAAGLKKTGQCHYREQSAASSLTIMLRSASGSSVWCVADDTVEVIRLRAKAVQREGLLRGAPNQVVERVSAALATQPACATVSAREARCVWTSPAKATHIESAEVKGTAKRMELTLRGVSAPRPAAEGASESTEASTTPPTDCRERFAVEEICLGMERRAAEEALEGAGYRANSYKNDLSASFRRGNPGTAPANSIQLKYDDHRVTSITGKFLADSQPSARQKALTTRYGTPDSCRTGTDAQAAQPWSETLAPKSTVKWRALVEKHGYKSRVPRATCAWTRETGGQGQRLFVRFFEDGDEYRLDAD